MAGFASRNREGLTARQIEYCREGWELLAGGDVELDCSQANEPGSRTRYRESDGKVYLGANAFPGQGPDANSRMSTLACLAHELAHVERHRLGYDRPVEFPDVLVDEAETSLRACFCSVLNRKDREDLVEDARDRLIRWLSLRQQDGEEDEG